MALSDAKVKAAKVPEGKKQFKLADGGGLYLLVNKSGKYWQLDYRFAGKRKTMLPISYFERGSQQARGCKKTA